MEDIMEALRILHLEDDAEAAELIRRAVAGAGLETDWHTVVTGEEFERALDEEAFDIIVSDSAIAGLDGSRAMTMARERTPDTPFIFVSGHRNTQNAARQLAAGAYDFVGKDELWRLPPTLKNAQTAVHNTLVTWLAQSRALLVEVVKQLSLARSLDAIVDIVKSGARQLNGADGATFVMRDGDFCHYVAEDAIGPLWAGRRFPIRTCVSGWAMLNKQAAVIPDIYKDARIPADAYRPTFVKSLVMVPIRADAPIGAIGNYWARSRTPSADEVELIQALADSTSLAFENLELYRDLERRVQDRTARLQMANQELEAFSYSVSHDLRAPLRAVQGYVDLMLGEIQPPLDGQALAYAQRLRKAADRMHTLIEDLLSLSRVSQAEADSRPVALGRMAREVLANLEATSAPRNPVQWEVDETAEVDGDPGLLRIALENLLSNAWKYTQRTEEARIEFRTEKQPDGATLCTVRDNGAGFDMAYADNLFRPFHRLHAEIEFPGTGIGLAIVQRIIQKHGGRIWAEAVPDAGATFRFLLPARAPAKRAASNLS
jgi:signal transduction histidine kinase/FixJ family two-component response regulator